MKVAAAVRPLTLSEFRTAPLRALGISLVLLLRYAMALFFLGSCLNKVTKGWLWSDYGKQIFEARLAELDPASFGALFLSKFAIPFYIPVAWVFVATTIVVTLTFTLGLAARAGGVAAFWLMTMIGIGGYYDASLLPLWVVAALMIVFPTGRWFGLDGRYHARYPASPWFR
ncbi:MAG: DoxX family protein [Gammaproteobacteria bacterium]